jgi:DNA-binding HxlR family transcriptional regulator
MRDITTKQTLRDFKPGTFAPKVKMVMCPIEASVRVLGRKWTMFILRDIGLRKINRFNQLVESISGLTPRVLSMRLKELETAGYIERIVESETSEAVRWGLTEKGADALQIVMQFTSFGSKWHADEVFEDKKPRTLKEVFKPEALRLLRSPF